MTDDIICTVPYFCGDTSCPVGVHLQHYWINFEGKRVFYTVCDTDGDHARIRARDVPTPKKETQLWRQYAQQVADTGVDPLGNYWIRPLNGPRQAWQARLRLGILGVCVIARRGGRGPWLTGKDIPQPVRDFLCIDSTANATCFMDRTEFPDPDCRVTRARRAVYLRFHVNGPVIPPTPDQIKRAARRHLREATP